MDGPPVTIFLAILTALALGDFSFRVERTLNWTVVAAHGLNVLLILGLATLTLVSYLS